MKKYELMLVLPGTLDENEAKKRSEEVFAMIKEQDGEAEIKPMGKTRLAYPIKQIRYGYFFAVVFSVQIDVLKAIKEKLTIANDLLRAMITEYNEKFTASQKLTYTTDEMGVTRVSQNGETPEESVKEAPVDTAPAKASMQDINKKLDEILDGDVISGV